LKFKDGYIMIGGGMIGWTTPVNDCGLMAIFLFLQAKLQGNGLTQDLVSRNLIRPAVMPQSLGYYMGTGHQVALSDEKSHPDYVAALADPGDSC
jgi:hypothetical protein